ncbi:hypothetical protein BDK51DRAFT_34281 [Blyttiomyces helicus]|uniref:Uncharacterized protein n=1 Tax=Blyttiomyces helicus TaxID=388810 RepID=A0A4P9WN46_9FUNG|nr:hypothetical protein BDK51DRAFT_34281 [Blyttiomyces helicus]|eukprot:RKO94509.1 hypothetical protein BDK51DRAFT_34281 [Blyttiomyces helicus]
MSEASTLQHDPDLKPEICAKKALQQALQLIYNTCNDATASAISKVIKPLPDVREGRRRVYLKREVAGWLAIGEGNIIVLAAVLVVSSGLAIYSRVVHEKMAFAEIIAYWMLASIVGTYMKWLSQLTSSPRRNVPSVPTRSPALRWNAGKWWQWIWAKMAEIFEGAMEDALFLEDDLRAREKREGGNVVGHIAELEAMASTLKALGEENSTRSPVNRFLRSLLPSYDATTGTIRAIFKAGASKISVATFCAILTEAAAQAARSSSVSAHFAAGGAAAGVAGSARFTVGSSSGTEVSGLTTVLGSVSTGGSA